MTSSLRKITKDQSHLQSSVFCLNRTRITHSTGNDLFYIQSRWILIWSTNKNFMKDKSLNVPVTLDIGPQKYHKTQISSSIDCFLLESNKNYTFHWNWVFQWSITGGLWFEAQVKMLWRIKSRMRAWMYLRHLTSCLRKITKHKSHLRSSVLCLNRTKFTHLTGNYFFYGQYRWILIWSTNKNVMKDKSLNVPATLDIAPQKNHKTQISSSIVCFLLE